MIEKVDSWKTRDGKVWDNELTATQHEEYLDLVGRCPTIYGNVEGCKIYWDTIWTWAEENRFFVRDLVKYMHNRGMFKEQEE